MPNANWSNPILTSTYTNFVSEVKNRDEDLALQFDGTTSTNIPTGTIRWDSSANRWKKWTGAAWGELTSTYALTALTTTGSVGIGTSSPTSKLDLVDSAADPVLSIRAGSTFSPSLYFEATGVNAGAIKYDRATQALTFSNNSSSTERLRIDSSGRVGIGTSSPQAQLQVLDRIKISDSTQAQGSLQLGDGASTSFNVGVARWNGSTNAAGAGGLGYFSQGTANSGGHYFYTGDAAAGSQTPRMVILPGGNVGIGTSSPVSGLDFAGSIPVFTLKSSTNTGSGTPILSSIESYSSVYGLTNAKLSFLQGTSGFADLGGIALYTKGFDGLNERFRITSAGQVGIGTTSPGQALEVAGSGVFSGGVAGQGAIIGRDGSTGGATYGCQTGDVLITTAGATNIRFTTNSSERLRIDSSGRLLVGTTSTTNPALLQVNGDALVNSLNAGPLAGARNRIINGGMQIDQRNSGASISSGVGAVTYSVDRWYVYATGAAVSAQRVTSSNSAFTSALRISGAASNTGVLIGQRIEFQNSYDLADKTVTLSFYAASSASVTLNWKMYYAGAANDFTTKTQSNTGTQATTSTLTKYSATFTLSASATTGVCLEFELSALTSGSVDITGVQLELGSVSTPFERRGIGAELELCQRYFASETCYGFGYTSAAGNFRSATSYLPVNMRVTPTVGVTSATGSNVSGETAQVQSSRNVGFFTSVLAAGAYTHDITFTATAEL